MKSKFKNVNLNLFEKGSYEPVNNEFMIEGHLALQSLEEVQEKFNKGDTDTFINELRDSMVGWALGFNFVNVDKHGFDCKKIHEEKNYYLEVKSASFVAQSWQATFNDTTLEKTEAFKDEKLFLALAVWKNASELLFICFGQNSKLGDYLEDRVNNFLKGNSVRSTQSISLSSLVFNYGFKIITGGADKSREEVLQILNLKNQNFRKLKIENIIHYSDFTDILDY